MWTADLLSINTTKAHLCCTSGCKIGMKEQVKNTSGDYKYVWIQQYSSNRSLLFPKFERLCFSPSFTGDLVQKQVWAEMWRQNRLVRNIYTFSITMKYSDYSFNITTSEFGNLHTGPSKSDTRSHDFILWAVCREKDLLGVSAHLRCSCLRVQDVL